MQIIGNNNGYETYESNLLLNISRVNIYRTEFDKK